LISGVILAAGRSDRLGRPKQLLPVAGMPLLAHTVRHAVASSLDEVVLVLGHEAMRITDAVGEWGQRPVINPDYSSGQSASLRIGLGALDPTTEAVVFLLGDQPQVSPETIDALIRAFRATGGPIVAAEYGDRTGNPVLFGRELFPELARLTGDEGARTLVRERSATLVRVPIAAEPPRDVDTEDDYAELLRSWGE
jgi:molybdenum cofactor cytidylyltransferase